MEDRTILDRISSLVDEEHRLRGRAAGAGEGLTDDERRQLRDLAESLDQCWDLLRRRRAARQAGTDPETAGARDRVEVERYLQ